MRRYLGTLAALFTMLTLLISSASASASGAVDDGQLSTTTTKVTQTFRLTLYGTAPKGDAMIVKYRIVAPNGTSSGTAIHVFCGDYRSALRDYAAKPACKGGGTVYQRSISVTKGSTIYFSFARQKATDARDRSTTWYTSSHKLNYNRLDRAWYRYGA